MNPVAPNISWLDRTPFLGELTAIIHFCRGQRELAAEALRCARHNTAIPLFGVFGGLLTGPIGSFFGGMLASRSFDGFLYLLSYGYAKTFWDPIIEREDWKRLLMLAITDGLIASEAFIAKQFVMRLLTRYTVTVQSRGGHAIQCSLSTCKEPDWTKGRVQMKNNTNRVQEFNFLKELLPAWCNQKFTQFYDIPWHDSLGDYGKLMLNEQNEGTDIQVENIFQLESGDHVVFIRGSGKSNIYHHHAIVGEVYPEKGMYTVYEQSPNINGSQTSKASIKENLKCFYPTSLYTLHHGNTAISKVDSKERAHYICHHARGRFLHTQYNLITNNCEHFAYFCATGDPKSYQILNILYFFVRFWKKNVVLAMILAAAVNFLLEAFYPEWTAFFNGL